MQKAISFKNWHISMLFLFCFCLPIKLLAETPKLSQLEVVKIASAEAIKRKIDLTKFYPPQVSPPKVSNKEPMFNDTWSVFYTAIDAKPGAHFFICVNDKTKAVKFLEGE